MIATLPESKCQGSVAADIGGMVSGDAPQLDSTSSPWMWTWEEALVGLRAALSGAIWLNWTLDRQPVNPGVLYLYISWSIFPISMRNWRGENINQYYSLLWKAQWIWTHWLPELSSQVPLWRRLRFCQTLTGFFTFHYRLKLETFRP